ncbi:MAG: hypothetical protein DDG58_11145 [Ardenticatenia bacterium]|nr:MAG: hypothetical protein DDG58_11145 [Ardenticatenia bacterium]
MKWPAPVAQMGRAGEENTSTTGASARPYHTPELLALQVHKRARWCTIAKVVPLDGELVLAVVWRNQRGTQRVVSLPQVVLDYARRLGVRRFCLRDDRYRRMGVCSLDTFDRGRLGADGERYVPLTWLTPCQWREWPFAKTVVRLGDTQPTAEAKQLVLPFEV